MYKHTSTAGDICRRKPLGPTVTTAINFRAHACAFSPGPNKDPLKKQNNHDSAEWHTGRRSGTSSPSRWGGHIQHLKFVSRLQSFDVFGENKPSSAGLAKKKGQQSNKKRPGGAAR